MLQDMEQPLECPQCKKKSAFKIWSNINVTLNPELKKKVLDRSIFVFSCPYCGQQVMVNYDSLYYDMKQGIMLYLVTSEKSEAEIYHMIMGNWSNEMIQQMVQGENYRLRIVHSLDELDEKIVIFDANRDDRIIEICKYLSLQNLREQGMKLSDEAQLLYFRENNKEFFHIVDQENVLGKAELPVKMYEDVSHEFGRWLSSNSKDNIFVDRQWASYVVNENRNAQKLRVCVYGAGEYSAPLMSAAREIGRIIGNAGGSLTYGGFGDGILGEVAQGVFETGGYILGVLPEKDREGHPTYEHCDRILRSSDKRKRKELQANHADIFIVLPTGIGVMDELFEVLVLKSYGQLKQRVLICNIDHCYDTLLELLEEQDSLQYVEVFETVEDCEKLLRKV